MVDDNDKDNVDDINNMDNGNENNNNDNNMDDVNSNDNDNSNKQFFPKRSIIQCFFPKSEKNFGWAEVIFLIRGARKRQNLLAVGSSLGHVKKYLEYSDHTVDMSLWGKANLKLV